MILKNRLWTTDIIEFL